MAEPQTFLCPVHGMYEGAREDGCPECVRIHNETSYGGQVTPDDSCYCGICGKETSLAMIVVHLANEHDVDPDEIANAPIVGGASDGGER